MRYVSATVRMAMKMEMEMEMEMLLIGCLTTVFKKHNEL
jgi:hypothetical protein